MKRALIILLSLLLLSGAVLALQAVKSEPYDLQVKKLYSAPDENSNLVYNIPIEVKLLDISEDSNWYKVKISFSLGPLSYTYVGWAQIPVGEILTARSHKVAKATPPESQP
ncbi:MAG: hypothetical protein ACPL4K_02615 [Candidatus Margulisiibacteriota bacterium]